MWHLLSLDAPTVAVVWTAFFGRCAGVLIPRTDLAAMFLAVWILYAADRLLDAKPPVAGPSTAELRERHHFHHRHRRRLVWLLCVASLPLALLLHRTDARVLHLEDVLACLLCAWLLLVHARPGPGSRAHRLPKELAVGVFFPAAVAIPTLARAPALRPALLPPAVLFGALCMLNCLFLYAWEHPLRGGQARNQTRDQSRRSAHPTTHFGARHAVGLAYAAMAGGVLSLVLPVGAGTLGQPFAGLVHPRLLPFACVASLAMLLCLHARRDHMEPLQLRAWADFVLLTPLPFEFVLRWKH